MRLSIDIRLIAVLLLIIIGVMLFIWKPWDEQPLATDRTINITGQATVKAVPDEFVFSPYYQFKSTDRKTALADLTKKSSEITAKLKELGVDDSKIKSNSSGYDSSSYYYYTQNSTGQVTYTLNLTVTATSQDQAQKVQDYLATTGLTGTVSPRANFSDGKRKELENQARDEATKDARQKADQSAKNLGFKITKIKSVNDGTGFGNNYRQLYEGANDASLNNSASSKSSSLQVQPGENDLSYSVSVVYFIR